MLLVYMAYFLFCNYHLHGETIGKKVFGLKTVPEKFIYHFGTKEFEQDFMTAFKRAAGLLLCYCSFGTFFAFGLFTQDQRGLHDFLSGTMTVEKDWFLAVLNQKNYSFEVVQINVEELKIAS